MQHYTIENCYDLFPLLKRLNAPQLMYQTDPPRPPQETLPTMYDLPSEEVEEPGLPDEFHRLQADLLSQTCQPPNQPIDQVFVASDLNLYYDPRHPRWYKRPDWFVVLGVRRFTQQQDLRWSYVIWQEGVTPLLVVELLSPGTTPEDLGQTLREVNQPPTKWEVYERILRIPYYVVFDRYVNQFRAFCLSGTRYQELSLQNQRLWLDELQLGLGIWQGVFEETTGLWLRWYDRTNRWIPTPVEQAQQEQQRAEQLEMQLEQERQRSERLAERLRGLGIEPDALSEDDLGQ